MLTTWIHIKFMKKAMKSVNLFLENKNGCNKNSKTNKWREFSEMFFQLYKTTYDQQLLYGLTYIWTQLLIIFFTDQCMYVCVCTYMFVNVFFNPSVIFFKFPRTNGNMDHSWVTINSTTNKYEYIHVVKYIHRYNLSCYY